MKLAVQQLTLKVASQTVVNNVSFSLEEGESLAIIGPSGSGKTSLLKGILGIADDMVMTGCAEFYSGKIIGAQQRAQRRIGYIPQDLAMWPHLTVLATIELALLFSRQKAFRDHVLSDPEQLINLCGLKNLRNQKPTSLSGGEKQRLALARALAGNPELLILDEPFSGLDIVAKSALIDLIRSLQSRAGFSMISVSHDLAETRALGTHIMIMDKGSSIWMGEKHNLSTTRFLPHWNPLLSSLVSPRVSP